MEARWRKENKESVCASLHLYTHQTLEQMNSGKEAAEINPPLVPT
jgi:hypothetical protein